MTFGEAIDRLKIGDRLSRGQSVASGVYLAYWVTSRGAVMFYSCRDGCTSLPPRLSYAEIKADDWQIKKGKDQP